MKAHQPSHTVIQFRVKTVPLEYDICRRLRVTLTINLYDLGKPRCLPFTCIMCIYRNNNHCLPAFVESMSSSDRDPLGHLYLDAVFLEFSATRKVAAWCREMNKNPLMKPTVTYTHEIACIGFAEIRVLTQTEKSDLSTKSSAFQFSKQSNRMSGS